MNAEVFNRFATLTFALALCAALAGQPVSAQAPGTLTDVEVEPITCWWRSSASAVRSGEPFTLMLTCQVVETDNTRVVPDTSKLDSSVVQLQPFEVTGGSRAPDMRVPGKRFFQYVYELRLINEGAFGADVEVPQLQISYRIESEVARGEAIQGRDLNYNLRPIAIRLLSIVPGDTMDIREAPAAAFAAVEARESRADLLRLIGTLLVGLAGVVLVVMLLSLFRTRLARARVVSWQVPAGRAAAAAQRTLAEVRQQSRGGWDQDLAGRALAAARVAAALAAGQAIGQTRVAAGATPLDGQLLVPGWLGRGGAFVSGAVTAQSATDATVAASLAALTRARYGRAATMDGSALDEALDAATAAARRAASKHSWLSELIRRIRRG